MAQTNALPKAVASAPHSASPSGSTTDPAFEASSGHSFLIEKGVPLPPPAGRGRNRKPYRRLPFAQMQVGDSFFCPTDEPVAESRNFLTAAKHKGTVVTCRRVSGGIRVWRVA